MQLLTAIKERRSIRKFTSDPVPREVLEDLIKKAMWAPSAMNTQPWKFFVLTGKQKDQFIRIAAKCIDRLDERLKQLFKDNMRSFVHGFFKDLGGAPAVVVVLTAKPDIQGYMLGSYESSTAALYNFLLLAHEAGLGACWMTGPLWVEDELLEFLAHPDWRLVGLTPVGYPAQSPPVPPRKHETIVWLGEEEDEDVGKNKV
ncbi:MAG: nitroreductase family protein [Negativicutes bacterium]|nr:nitroreductase family protein [Negativicutes bacterium]